MAGFDVATEVTMKIAVFYEDYSLLEYDIV
jgi:hypothetical protein